jgi:hypothetical protein
MSVILEYVDYFSQKSIVMLDPRHRPVTRTMTSSFRMPAYATGAPRRHSVCGSGKWLQKYVERAVKHGPALRAVLTATPKLDSDLTGATTDIIKRMKTVCILTIPKFFCVDCGTVSAPAGPCFAINVSTSCWFPTTICPAFCLSLVWSLLCWLFSQAEQSGSASQPYVSARAKVVHPLHSVGGAQSPRDSFSSSGSRQTPNTPASLSVSATPVLRR